MTDLHGPTCVAVINMKGGVGKTTVAALLARHASRTLRLNVLAVDLDPQANLSQALMGGQGYSRFLNARSPSIVEIFNGYRPASSDAAFPGPLNVDETVVRRTEFGGTHLELIPSRFDFSNNLVDSLKPDPRVLTRVIADKFQDKDLVLIDCAPTESILTQAAYHASRYILVPVKPEYFATIGFPLLNDSLEAFRRSNRGQQLDVIGVVINNSVYHYSGNRGGPERDRSLREIRRAAQTNGWDIFERPIPLSRGFPKMMRGDFNHLGDAPMFRFFADEFFLRLGLPS